VPAGASSSRAPAAACSWAWGATLAFGCNIGGFFSAVSALSLAGFAMMVGLGVGAFLGLRYLLWETAHRPALVERPRAYVGAGPPRREPAAARGVLLLAALIGGRRSPTRPSVIRSAASSSSSAPVFGVIFQRSRFCLVRAFREPFMTGDAEHTRAAALALGVSTLGFAILKFTDLKDRATGSSRPPAWAGSWAAPSSASA